MTPEQIVYQTLTNDAGINALVAGRISSMKVILGAQLPCITYQMIGAHQHYTHDGPDSMQDPSVQIDCWAQGTDYDGLTAICTAVLNCLAGADSPRVGRHFFITDAGTDMLEEKGTIARKKIEAIVWHRNT